MRAHKFEEKSQEVAAGAKCKRASQIELLEMFLVLIFGNIKLLGGC